MASFRGVVFSGKFYNKGANGEGLEAIPGNLLIYNPIERF